MKKREKVIQQQKEAFVEAMGRSFGNISSSCKAAGISRSQYYLWRDEDPDFMEKVNSTDYSESFKDAIESKLSKLAIADENPTILIFLAKTKCKDRGYVERQEIAFDKQSTFKVGYTDDETEDEDDDD